MIDILAVVVWFVVSCGVAALVWAALRSLMLGTHKQPAKAAKPAPAPSPLYNCLPRACPACGERFETWVRSYQPSTRTMKGRCWKCGFIAYQVIELRGDGGELI